MGRTATVVRTELPAGRRVLVISDIHGNLPFFRGVLSAARYTPEDVLVLLGDLVEKGPDSLSALRYIMALAEKNTVYCVRGNCDNLVSEFVRDEGAPEAGFYHHYLNVWRDRCLLVQMGQAAGRGSGAGGSSTGRTALSFLPLCRSKRFSRSAFDTTQKLERLMAAAPNMGFSVSPKGMKSPAASGMPMTL